MRYTLGPRGNLPVSAIDAPPVHPGGLVDVVPLVTWDDAARELTVVTGTVDPATQIAPHVAHLLLIAAGVPDPVSSDDDPHKVAQAWIESSLPRMALSLDNPQVAAKYFNPHDGVTYSMQVVFEYAA